MPSASDIFIYAVYDMHQPLLNARWNVWVYYRMHLPMVEVHIQWLVDGMELFLQMKNKEYGACCAASRHEAKVAVFNTHFLS